MVEPPRHESSDVHAGRVAWVIVGVGLMVLLAALVAFGVLRGFGARNLTGAVVEPHQRARHLAPDLHQQLLDYQRAKTADAQSYTWEDDSHQFARVPVEVAMGVLAEPKAADSEPRAAAPSAAAPTTASASTPGWQPHPGATLPLGLRFRDEAGRDVRLADFFDGAPVALVFGYYTCNGLCPEIFRGVREALEGTRRAGSRPPRMLAVSIDPQDGAGAARQRRAETLQGAHDIDAHFLSDAQGSAARLASAAGFGFRYDAATRQFAHPAGLVLVDGRGVIRDYLFGVRFDPARLARSGSAPRNPASPLLMLCYHFDSVTGRYDLAIGRILAASCGVTLLALGAWFWHERRRA